MKLTLVERSFVMEELFYPRIVSFYSSTKDLFKDRITTGVSLGQLYCVKSECKYDIL